MIYLDNAATTAPDEHVAAGMILHFLNGLYGNPGSIHVKGIEAKHIVDRARSSVADYLGCEPRNIIFTSGGSEGNNTVIKGLADHLKSTNRNHIIISATEHDSVFRAAEYMSSHGFRVDVLPVDSGGCVKLEELDKLMTENTGLVSVMFVNNETGTINPIKEIGIKCRKYGALLHTDCVQAAGCFPIYVNDIGCDFATISAHKIHGPKGIGAIYARDVSILTPLVGGGAEQEFGIRGGTENVAAIDGFGTACGLPVDTKKIIDLKLVFYGTVFAELQRRGMKNTVHINGKNTVSKILNVRFDGIDGETLVRVLDTKGVCVSAGSACRSREIEPSRTLLAMGLSEDEAKSSIRVSFSSLNTAEEVKEAAIITADTVEALATLGSIV